MITFAIFLVLAVIGVPHALRHHCATASTARASRFDIAVLETLERCSGAVSLPTLARTIEARFPRCYYPDARASKTLATMHERGWVSRLVYGTAIAWSITDAGRRALGRARCEAGGAT